MTRALFILFSSLLLAVMGLAVTQSMTTSDTKTELPPEMLELIAGHSEQVRRGAGVYDLVCSNCHGNTGLGIEEGRAEFLPEHQRCETCHRSNNAPTKANVEISEKNSFNIGTPPALHSHEMLSKFGSAAGLYAYISAAMPRHDPGVLTQQDYLDITAFLLALNDVLPNTTVVTSENAATLLFVE